MKTGNKKLSNKKGYLPEDARHEAVRCSTRSTKQNFSRAHEILLSGLMGSGMSYPNIFKLEMAIKSDKKALELAIWIRDRLDEMEKFPTPEEIMRQAKVKPYAAS